MKSLRNAASMLALAMTLASCVGSGGGRIGADWVPLGQREVTDRLDRDRIAVTGQRGDFRRIKLTVQRASVDFRRVIVHYANGSDQDVALRSTVRAGGETRAIDLTGGDRVIRSVEFLYDANTTRGRAAVVRLFGSR